MTVKSTAGGCCACGEASGSVLVVVLVIEQASLLFDDAYYRDALFVVLCVSY